MYSVPKSVNISLIGQYVKMNFSKIAFATVFDYLLGIATVTKYLVELHIKFTAYLLSWSDNGKGPIVSIVIISNCFG